MGQKLVNIKLADGHFSSKKDKLSDTTEDLSQNHCLKFTLDSPQPQMPETPAAWKGARNGELHTGSAR